MKNEKYIALVPAYEPSESLLEVLQGLKSEEITAIVVDDGSGDGFSSVFEQAESFATVLHHTQNRGKGCALKTGYDYIGTHFGQDKIVVTMDSDGQHKVSDAIHVLELAEQNPEALVLGCRKFTGKVPFRSRFGNGVTRFVYRMSTGVKVSDTQTGLRAFSMKQLQRMQSIEGERYEYEMNVLLEYSRQKLPILEFPIETIYLNDNESSHFDTVRDSARIYAQILKFMASSFTGFLIDYLMYTIFTLIFGALSIESLIAVPIANVSARIISATANFLINKHFVFQNKDSVGRTGAQYFVLAACILCGNTILLSFLVEQLHVNRYAGKLVTEVTFFVFSYLAQRFIVFRKKEQTAK